MNSTLRSSTISLHDAATELGLVNEEIINTLLSYLTNNDLQIFFSGDIRGYSTYGPVIDQSGGKHGLPIHLIPDVDKNEYKKYLLTLSGKAQLIDGYCHRDEDSSLSVMVMNFKHHDMTYKSVSSGAEVFVAQKLPIDCFYLDRHKFNQFINDSNNFLEQENSPSNLFSIFHEMNGLMYEEITISFLEGDYVELEAKNKKRKYITKNLGLRDTKKSGNAILNLAGLTLKGLTTRQNLPLNEKNKSRKQELKKLINSWFGVPGDPFRKIGNPSTYYEPLFKVKDETKRADKRAKYKAEQNMTSFDEQENTISNDFEDEYDETKLN